MLSFTKPKMRKSAQVRALAVITLAVGLSACASAQQIESELDKDDIVLTGKFVEVDKTWYWTGTDEADIDLLYFKSPNLSEPLPIIGFCPGAVIDVDRHVVVISKLDAPFQAVSLQNKPQGTIIDTSYVLRACNKIDSKDRWDLTDPWNLQDT